MDFKQKTGNINAYLVTGVLLILGSYISATGSSGGNISGLTAGIQSTEPTYDSGGYLIVNGERYEGEDMVFSVEENSSAVYYSYAESEDQGCGDFKPPCGKTGIKKLYTSNKTEKLIYEQTTKTRQNSEIHDIEISGETLYFTDLENEKIVQINLEGQKIWEWNASSVYRKPGKPRQQDWLHINDVDIFNGTILVSVRNTNQLLLITKQDGVVETINPSRNPDKLNGQHNPQMLTENRVLVADSQNHRIVELKNVNGSWQQVWSVTEVSGKRLDWPRDADRLSNGRTLITDTRNSRVVLINQTGGLVDQERFGSLTNLYEADLKNGEIFPAPTAQINREKTNTNALYGLVTGISPVTPKNFGANNLVLLLTGIVSIIIGVRSWYKQE